MPYARANYFVGFVFIVIIIGFWPTYFAKYNSVPLAFHVHAFTSLIWVILVMLQSWSIHNKKNNLHRTVGKLSLIMFPLLIVGFVMIINVTAEGFSQAKDPFAVQIAPNLAGGMFFAIITYLVLYYLALKNRRKIHLHAGYMLVTPLVLFESPFSRIMEQHFPFMIFTGSEGVQFVLDSIVISMLIAIVFSSMMYLRDRKKGVPFLVVTLLMTLQAIPMAFAGDIAWIGSLFMAYAQVPPAVTIAVGFMLGALISWLGWTGPTKKQKLATAAE